MISSHPSTKSQANAPEILSTPTPTSVQHNHSFVNHFHGTHQDPISLKTTHNPRTSKNDSTPSAQASNELIQSKADWLQKNIEAIDVRESKKDSTPSAQANNEFIQSGIDWLQRNIEAIDVRDKACQKFNQLIKEADPSHEKKSTTQINIDKQRINECMCAALFFAEKPPEGLTIKSIKTGDLAVDFIVEIAIENQLRTIGFDPFEPPQNEKAFEAWLQGAYSKHVDNKKVITDDNGKPCAVIGALDLRNKQGENAKNILEKITDQRQNSYGNLVVIHPNGKVEWLLNHKNLFGEIPNQTDDTLQTNDTLLDGLFPQESTD